MDADPDRPDDVPTNGWKNGDDPTLRSLRIVAAIVLIVTIPAGVVLDRDPLLVFAVILGTLALLGIVELGARLPDIFRR